MSAGIALVVDAAFALLEAKFERDIILAKIREREAAGDSNEQITLFIKALRDEAIKRAEDAVK